MWRDLSVRYKQTALGIIWSIAQPLLLMLVLTLFLGRLVGIPSNGIPYAVFAYTALVPWILFTQSLSGASNSLVANASLLTRIYFPRLVIPIAAVGSHIVDYLLALSVLIVLIVIYGMPFSERVVWVVPFAGLAVLTSLGLGIGLSALSVKYRDVGFALPLVLQLLLFATPVAYPSSLIPEQWRTIYSLNPMVGVIEGTRWSLLGMDPGPQPETIAASALVTLLILCVALAYFRRTEDEFADVI
jgi:lipopolysaccharide transport system permease protein